MMRGRPQLYACQAYLLTRVSELIMDTTARCMVAGLKEEIAIQIDVQRSVLTGSTQRPGGDEAAEGGIEEEM